jgi:hypothetical protein
MKTLFHTTTLRRWTIPAASLFLLAFILTTAPSCYVGADGNPGLAYIAFEWEDTKPEYIDCGTPAVPPQFTYGSYYRITPGWYHAYYDGKVWNGSAWGTYAWEMDYEIWINPGERGGYGYNGRDGMNTYLNFVCSPYGPELFRHDDYLRKAREVVPSRSEVNADNERIVTYQVGEYTVKIIIRKVAPRDHTTPGNTALN